MIAAIQAVLNDINADIADLINCMEKIRGAGNVVLMKLDGERASVQYTVLILFPGNKEREMIRADKETLKEAVVKVLTEFVKTS